MPGIDGTGPGGLGPMTGGGFGRCAESGTSKKLQGRGLARGRCRGNRYNAFSNNQAPSEPSFSVSAEDSEKQTHEDNAGFAMQLKQTQEQNEILLKENETLRATSKKIVKKVKVLPVRP